MPRKKRSTFGSVTKLGPGRWRLRWWADGPDGRKRRTEVVRGTRRQADDRLAEIRLGVGSDQGGCMTLGQVWDKWAHPEALDRLAEGSLSQCSVRNMEHSWTSKIAPRWADVPCSSIAAVDVQDWLLTMTNSTGRLAKTYASQVMDKAVLYGVCQSNPFSLRLRLSKSGKSTDAGIYSLEEMRSVLKAVRGSYIEPGVILAGFGSARVGESLGVMASEVRRKESFGVTVAVAPVVRQVDRNGLISDKLKNRQSERPLVIPGQVGSRLLRLAGEAAERGDRWLVDSGDGTPISQQVAGREWKRALSDAGVPVHPYKNLRNSWETWMHWTMRVDPLMIEPMMGHAGTTVTSRHYDRPIEDMFVEAVAKAYKNHPFANGWDI